MRRGIENHLSVRVRDMDLTECTDLMFYVWQEGVTYSYTGVADMDDTEILHVTIPKVDAVKFIKGRAQIQVALTDASGMPRSHDPFWVCIGDFLEDTGYGD